MTQVQTARATGRWRLQVVHRTAFHYSGPVRSSYNEARLTPENSTRQTTLRSRVEIEPAASAFAYRDYWGATVTAFDLHSPHSELVVTGTSIVEAGPDLAGHDRVGWGALRSREVRDQFGELLAPTALTAMDDDVVAEARTAVGEARPHEAGPLLCRFVRERSAMVFGLADATMSRDESWLFVILGRSLERVVMTSRSWSGPPCVTRPASGSPARRTASWAGPGRCWSSWAPPSCWPSCRPGWRSCSAPARRPAPR